MPKVSAACDYQITIESFLSLEHTDAAKKQFVDKLTSALSIHKVYSKAAISEITQMLTDACIDMRNHPVLLFSSVDDFIGAPQLPAATVLLNFERLWKVVEQDFRVATPDINSGLCVEDDFYDSFGNYVKEGVYRVSVWGEFAKVIK